MGWALLFLALPVGKSLASQPTSNTSSSEKTIFSLQVRDAFSMLLLWHFLTSLHHHLLLILIFLFSFFFLFFLLYFSPGVWPSWTKKPCAIHCCIFQSADDNFRHSPHINIWIFRWMSKGINNLLQHFGSGNMYLRIS